MVLLSYANGGEVAECLKDAEEWFGSIFSIVGPWKEEDISKNRIVWLWCYGIPLHAWQERFLRFAMATLGSLWRWINIQKTCQSWNMQGYRSVLAVLNL